MKLTAQIQLQIRLLCLALPFLLAACAAKAPVGAPVPETATPSSQTAGMGQNTSSADIKGSLRFERLGIEAGLSQSTVLAILQDKFGFLWVGTQDGLNRYDGYTFKVFRPDLGVPGSISDRWVTTLFEDAQGYLWIGTRQGGLNRYDPATGQFTCYLHDQDDPHSLSSNHVTAILENKKGELWVGTTLGLNLLDRQSGRFQRFASDPDIPGTLSSNFVTSLFEDSRGILWIGADDGKLNRFNSATKSFRAYVYDPKKYTVLKDNSINEIVEDHTGSLWVASSEGLNRFDPGSSEFTRYTHLEGRPSSLASNIVMSLHLDRSGILWVGTDQGLDRFDPKTGDFTHYQFDPGDQTSLSSDAVYSIYEDRGGVLWVGTFGGGLNRYNKGQNKFTYYHHEPANPNSLSGNLIFPIYADSRGLVWIGTYGNGLNRFNPRLDLFTRYLHDPADPGSLPSNHIFSVFVDRTNTLWVGTDLGLSRRNPASLGFVHYFPDPADPNSLSGAPVQAIFQDHSGILWIGTQYGLERFDPSGKFIHYQADAARPTAISGNFITVIYEDRNQNLWIGTFDNGLNLFDRETETFTHYQRNRDDPASLSDNSVMAIHQDRNGNLWIATAGGGLNLYQPKTGDFLHYGEKDGLSNNVVYGILEDEAGYLWLSTNYGLSRFDPKTISFRNYTVSDGLQSNEFNMNAFARDRTGLMYFGGIDGFNTFRPAEVRDSAYAPPVVLTAFATSGQPDPSQPRPEKLSQVTLAWPNNNFSFEFAALSFSQPGRNQYAYMLENFDDGWNYIGTSREGRYTNLPGGTYHLRLRGTNNDGIWNESSQALEITVIPPFWQTWPFRILVILTLAGLVAGAYRIRVRSIQDRNLQLERLVGERTQALQKRTTEMEALYAGDEKIIRSVTLDQVFQAIVEVAVKMLYADRSVVFVWDQKQTRVVPRVSHGFSSASLTTLNFSKEESLIGKVLETGEPLVVSNLDAEALRPEVRAVIAAEGILSLVNLPISVDNQVIGIFNVCFTHPGAISEDTVRLFMALAQRAALSIENMQLFEQTKELAVVEERNRVARDLHDSAKQKAFAALAQLGAANGILKTDPSAAWSHLGEAENLVYEVIQELTFLIQEMYPMALKEKGLATTLREYIFEWENRNGVMINLLIENPQRMTLEVEQAIYRMIQEALANVARHSHADQVSVSLVYHADKVEVAVEDNGLGFDAHRKPNGMGLRTIRERAESIGGQACIQSEPGKGTKVIITLPQWQFIESRMEVPGGSHD
jgi:ligand-binding sensor domain-containing protein/signal transduction histidine kinase